MAKTKEVIYTPGEEIAIEEQYTGKENTFSENGSIKATAMGKVVFDEGRKEVSLRGKAVQTIAVGDIVYGNVGMVKDTMVMVELKSAEGGKKITSKMAMIPVRSISTEFVSDPHNLFKIGDIVRARVVSASPLGIDLSTNEKGLGVIKAYCSNCRHEMAYSNGKVLCFSCGSQEDRRWFEAEQKPREFGERRDFNGRGFGGRPNFRGGPRNGGRSFGNNRRGQGFRPKGNFNKRF